MQRTVDTYRLHPTKFVKGELSGMAINWQADSLRRFEDAPKQIRRSAETIFEFLSVGFEITWFEVRDQRLWTAFIKPLQHLRDKFSLDREYFLIGHDYEHDLQLKTFKVEPAPHERYRIDPKVRFLASSVSGLRDACAKWSLEQKTVFIPLDVNVIRQTADPLQRQSYLHGLLRDTLWQLDRFDESEPVSSPGEFYGRETLVQQVLHKCLAGSPIAIFGLRKIGKTSLLRRVQALLETHPERISLTAFIQCNRIDVKSGRTRDVLRMLVDGWLASLISISKDLNLGANLEAIGATRKAIADPKKSSNPAAIYAAFQRDVERLIAELKQLVYRSGREGYTIVALFDEVDHVYPHLDGSQYWRQDFFDLWNTLQTVLRDHPALSFVLCGVNPSGVEQGSILGQPNPLFVLSRLYVRPMPPKDSGDLLRGLAGPMGLVFDEEAVTRAHALVSGHPALLRQLGSFVHSGLISRSEAVPVTGDTIDQVYARHKRTFLNHVDWILSHLRHVAPDEYRLLLDLCRNGSIAYITDWADVEFRDTFAQHLVDYGIIEFINDRPVVQIGIVRESVVAPKAGSFELQKAELEDLCKAIERLLRARIVGDVSRDQTLDDAIEAIVSSVPGKASQRSMSGEELRLLGGRSGLPALVESLNWDDYVLVMEKNYERFALNTGSLDKRGVLDKLRVGIKAIHLVRHNNDTKLRAAIDESGFSGFAGQILWVRELLSS